MTIVKSGAIKPALQPLPIEAACGPKRDAALEFMQRCPNATDAEVKKVCSYNLKAVTEIRSRMNAKWTK